MTATETFIPHTIRTLIEEAEAIGGEVTETQPHRFEFALPMRAVGGSIHMVVRGAVGYYVMENGKNRISASAHDVRAEIAYWGRQSA